MDDWGSDLSFGDGQDSISKAKKPKRGPVSGRLHVPMTLACLIAVAAVSFGIAWLMKDRVRSFWEMGLTFAAPFAALMGSALLVEQVSGRMTPACSRKAQMLFAAGTIVVAFAVGSLAEVLHQPVIIEHEEPEFDYLLVVDKSGSMQGRFETVCREAVHGLVESLEDECRVGIVAFDNEVRGSASIELLDEAQRRRIEQVIQIDPYGGTDFGVAMDAAMEMIDAMPAREKTMRIILVTDGTDGYFPNRQQFISWAQRLNDANSEKKSVELCAVEIEYPMLDMIKEAVEATEGKIVDKTDPSALKAELENMKVSTIIPEPVDTLKATFEGKTADGEPNTTYAIITAVLLLLLGLLSGISLMIMFSLQGQFRFQVILSALMGVCAFLLLNYGRHLGISPAWVCEGLAFSLFGLVFMRENGMGGSRKTTYAAKKQPVPASQDDFF